MTRSEVFRQALQDIYSESRSLQEFAAEYGIAVRHVRRMAKGERAVPDRVFTWLAMRNRLRSKPRNLHAYQEMMDQLDDPDALPD